jgi:branched-chain amino acid transport system ATP-binding protein
LGTSLLKITGLEVSYGPVQAVNGVDLTLEAGDIRAILGANGAGKSSIVRAIMGLAKVHHGTIEFPEGRPIQNLPPHQIRRRGIAWVPEGRQILTTLTVYDNLMLGGFIDRDKQRVRADLELVYELFPILRERRHLSGRALSGGEQQMLAIGRALMGQPKLLLMDEPSLGLAPIVVESVFRLIKEINSRGISILMVEQNARAALGVARWAYLLENGRVAREGMAAVMQTDGEVQRVYLGRSTSQPSAPSASVSV